MESSSSIHEHRFADAIVHSWAGTGPDDSFSTAPDAFRHRQFDDEAAPIARVLCGVMVPRVR